MHAGKENQNAEKCMYTMQRQYGQQEEKMKGNKYKGARENAEEKNRST